MKRIEWKDTWITTLIDAGFSAATAEATFRAMYGEDGPDLNKNPAEESMAMLGIIKIRDEFLSFSENISVKHRDYRPRQRSSKLDCN